MDMSGIKAMPMFEVERLVNGNWQTISKWPTKEEAAQAYRSLARGKVALDIRIREPFIPAEGGS